MTKETEQTNVSLIISPEKQIADKECIRENYTYTDTVPLCPLIIDGHGLQKEGNSCES